MLPEQKKRSTYTYGKGRDAFLSGRQRMGLLYRLVFVFRVSVITCRTLSERSWMGNSCQLGSGESFFTLSTDIDGTGLRKEIQI